MDAKEEGFLREIRAAPAEDGPRGTYADWLNERSDPRGEFINLQLALAKMDIWDPQRKVLEALEAKLWKEHHKEWMVQFGAEFGGVSPDLHIFRRGFLDSGSAYDDARRQALNQITANPELIVPLTRLAGADFAHIYQQPWMQQIRDISLDTPGIPAEMAIFPNIRKLEVNISSVAELQSLARHLPNVESLDIGCDADAARIIASLAGGIWKNLRSLDVSVAENCDFGLLAKGSLKEQLHKLKARFSSSFDSAATQRSLLEALPGLTALQDLDLRVCYDLRNMQDFADLFQRLPPGLQSLELNAFRAELDITGIPIKPLSNLKRLAISIDNQSLEFFVGDLFPKLEILEIKTFDRIDMRPFEDPQSPLRHLRSLFIEEACPSWNVDWRPFIENMDKLIHLDLHHPRAERAFREQLDTLREAQKEGPVLMPELAVLNNKILPKPPRKKTAITRAGEGASGLDGATPPGNQLG